MGSADRRPLKMMCFDGTTRSRATLGSVTQGDPERTPVMRALSGPRSVEGLLSRALDSADFRSAAKVAFWTIGLPSPVAGLLRAT